MQESVDRLQEIFDEKFRQFSGIPIGIYGVGKNAGTIVENIKGYDFACLIAADHFHEMMYGYEVLPLAEALKKVKLIIIAAIPASTAIIYERIREEVPGHIPIYNMHGYLLTGDDNYRNNAYWKSTEQELHDAIDAHDTISFDIFDTLVMRRVLQPRDVFDPVAAGIDHEHVAKVFKDTRIRAEEQLYDTQVSPTIDEIYDLIGRELKLESSDIKKLRDMELKAEISVTVPRLRMVNALKYSFDKGRRVILTSDMYFGEADIRKVLAAAGITGSFDMLVSCDHSASKERGTLYGILKEKANGSSILHIGDDEINDIQRARENGIDAFYVKKGYDILAQSSGAFLLDKQCCFTDRCMLGYLISEMFNDPFVLNASEGKLRVCDYKDIALRLLPVTAVYLSYIIENAHLYDMLMFASRDGYFLYRMYDKYLKEHPDLNLPGAEYIYMSRSAVSSAAVLSYEDIDVLSNKVLDDPKLNLKSFYKTQFHVDLPDMFDMTNEAAVGKWGLDGLKEKLRAYYDDILSVSALNREKYLTYLRSAGVLKCEHPAIVDIVTQGTLVYGMRRILNKDIGLIAMGTSCVPNSYIDGSDVHSLYGNITERIGNAIHSMSDFSENHLLLEMLYGSDDGQLSGFDDEGRPVFAKGTEYDKGLLGGVQDELERMIGELFDTKMFNGISKEFAMDVLRLCKGKYSDYDEDIASEFSFSDPYDGSLSSVNLIDYLK
ncbi:MAG: hypothetical protein IK111_08390 [Lachnospiraceae bacterium]|nr:hypothetical protein [Lachnospiraceae bacterium]